MGYGINAAAQAARGAAMALGDGNPSMTPKIFSSTRAAAGEATMTLNGTVNKAFLLLTVLMVGALWSWIEFASTGDVRTIQWPMLGGLLGGFVLALVISFRRHLAPVLSIPYAALEGVAIGGLSAVLGRRYPGIAITAVGLTFGVLGAMLLAYSLRLIRVTQRFWNIVVAATGAIALTYLLSIVLGFFHIGVPLLNSASPLGILISLAVIVVAAMNLALDFAIIEGGIAAGAPRYMEWYGAFGLVVTLVWLYLEILRLLSKVRQR